MKRITSFGLAAIAALAIPAAAAMTSAQELEAAPAPAASERDSLYRESPPPRALRPTMAQQKAMARGQQRMARLDAMRWYGFSGSRPTAAAIPFTTMYSPAWQMPGGRPFAWYSSSRPVVIYAPAPMYR